VILGGCIIAGPILLRSVEATRADVTELWIAFLRVHGTPMGTPGRTELHERLDREYEDIRRNRFFESIQQRTPQVGIWLEQIDSGVAAAGTLRAASFHEASTAFENLSAFMRDHSMQQYRALQTVIWSALLMLVGTAGVLAHLYTQNQRLAASSNTSTTCCPARTRD
jgi:hypothetical protein